VKQEQFVPVDINEVIGVDSQVINFGKFISGKILGSTLMVQNMSDRDQCLELAVDGDTPDYSCDEIFGPYLREELPFEYRDGASIANSERLMKSWYIENPLSKDLVKSMAFRLAPGCEREFIIVMKAPIDRVQFNLTSFLTLTLVEPRREGTGTTEKLLKGAEDLEEIEIEARAREAAPACSQMRVMIIGKLENPKIECLRELSDDTTNCNVISLGVK